jgi:glutathione synthase/RimK-type ligase-like ATP-grasp enzyme
MGDHESSPGRVVIATVADDIHAAAVCIALDEIGWSCDRWISSDLPSKQLSTIDICHAPYIHLSSDDWKAHIPVPLEKTVVWNRRRTDRLFIESSIHPADAPIAERESILLRDNIFSLLNTADYQVNEFYCARRAENKCLQLVNAKSIGFLIPRTCISNSIGDIRQFIRSCGTNGCIAKSFRTPMWKSRDNIYIGYSSIVTEDDLGDEPTTRSCPGIFQEFIKKKFDVRVTCFRQTLVATKILSQRYVQSQVDWRVVPPELIGIEPTDLPECVTDGCKRLMAAFGLQFACIDFAVTSDDQWYFLEINQMGQFLFVEEILPDIHLTDMFIQLLTRVEPVCSQYYGINFTDIASRAHEILIKEKASRAPKLTPGLVDEAPDKL